jgi:hypothetical protein
MISETMEEPFVMSSHKLLQVLVVHHSILGPACNLYQFSILQIKAKGLLPTVPETTSPGANLLDFPACTTTPRPWARITYTLSAFIYANFTVRTSPI